MRKENKKEDKSFFNLNIFFINKNIKIMKKNFLLLMLMALLPLAGWAADGDITEPTAKTNLAYTSAAQELVNAGSVAGTDYTMYYAVTQSATEAPAQSAFSAAIPKGTNAGTYYVYFISYNSATEAYSAIGAKVSVVIDKATLQTGTDKDYVAPTGVSSLTYNGTAKTLITAGALGTAGTAAKCGTFTYAVGTGAYEEALPKGTNAGTYAVKWKLSGSDNYAEATGTVNVAIAAKALPDVSATAYVLNAAESYTYNGSAQTLPTFTVKDGETTITDYDVVWYSAAPDGSTAKDAEIAVAEPTDAGDYYAKIFGKGNYDGSNKFDSSWKFTIGKKVAKVRFASNLGKVYDGVAVTDANLTASEIVSFNGLAAADAEASTTLFGNTVKVEFVSSAEKKNAGEYKIKASSTSTTTSLAKNYEVDWDVQGTYTIAQRPVTVSAQDLKYTRGAADLTAAKSADKEVTVVAAAEPATGKNVVIPSAEFDPDDATKIINEEGCVSDVDRAAIAAKLTLKIKKADYSTVKTYTGNADLTYTASTNAADLNYDITVEDADVIVEAEKLTVYVNTLKKEYGYELQSSDNTYDADGVELKKAPTYKVYAQDDTENAIADGTLLPVGTYIVKIDPSNKAELQPDNYALADDSFESGFLVVAKKKLAITVSDLSLNNGFAVADLDNYVSLSDYETVNDEEITFTYKFNSGVTTSGDPAVISYSTLPSDPIANAIEAALITDTEDDNYSVANANYDITWTYGKLTVLGANVLIYDRADANLANKIENASDVCAADDTKKYDVTFGSRELVADQWYAMVLPFPTTVSEFSQKLGYAVVDILGAGSANGISLKLHMGAIKANQPFIFKVAEAINLNTVTFSSKVITYVENPQDADEAGNKFKGTYAAVTRDFAENEAYMKGGSWLFGDASGVTIQATGAYLVGASANAPVITIEEPKGSATVINGIEANAEAVSAEGWYTINGVKLQAAPTQKGIYIFNGKKVAVK